MIPESSIGVTDMSKRVVAPDTVSLGRCLMDPNNAR